MTTPLAGRTAIVTGGGNGLGRAIGLALAKSGAVVALLGRDRVKLDATAAEVGNLGGTGIVIPCDTTDPHSVAAAGEALMSRPISILINNAGVAGPVAPLTEIAPDDWDQVFAANVRGTYLMCREFLPQMIARGSGDIINIASVAAKRPLLGRTPYCASKAAVLGMTMTLALEVAPHGVTVNSLSPGPVAGPRMARNFRLDAARRGISEAAAEEEYVARAAMKRMVTEEEVGRAVISMLTMSGLCGADIDLSAGMTAR